jgi:hypothetical protein
MRSLTSAGQVFGLVTAMATMVVLGAAPASAEVPSNDTIDGAKAITTLPFEEVVDTTTATTDAEDAAVNTNCGAPATNGSVWYTFTAGTSPAYVVDVSKSDFTAGVIVATGTPGNLSLVTCGPSTVGFEATQGQTYYVMAFSDNPDVVGGQLSFTVRESGPPPKVAMTVDDIGKANRSGTATISGTYTCVGDADLLVLQGTLQQEQKNNVQVRGSFDVPNLTCDGTGRWSTEVTPDSGKFARGLAATAALTGACNAVGCNVYDTLEVVRLRGGH